MPVALELLHQVKELQLQHGMRNDDFARYHAHCTSRIRTLRKQLKLASDYKGQTGANRGRNQKSQPIPYIAPKPVTVGNTATPSHVLLLALQVERALAEAAEAAAAAAGTVVHQQHVGKTRHASDGGRKRLNKAAVLAADFAKIVDAAGDDRLKAQTVAYVADVQGRCHAAHQRYAEAIAKFQESRAALVGLRATSTQLQWEVAVGRIIELDDRIAFATSQSGAGSYAAEPVNPSAGASTGKEAEDGAKYASVEWAGRTVPVVCLPVKQTLRDVDQLKAETLANLQLASLSEVEDKHGIQIASWAAFQLQSAYNKTVDALDRTTAALNDGLDAVRHDLRDATALGGSSAQTDRTKQLRLLQLYLNYHVQRYTVLRTVFVTANFRARFHLSIMMIEANGGKQAFRVTSAPSINDLCPAVVAATTAPIKAGNKQQERKQRRELAFNVQHVASPPEIERLCETTIRVVGDALLLPGVEDNEALSGPLEAARATAVAQRGIYTAEGWLLVARFESAADRDASAHNQKAAANLSQVLQHCASTEFPEKCRYQAAAEALLAAVRADATISQLSTSGAQAAYSVAKARMLLAGGAKPVAAKADGAPAAPERSTFVSDAPGRFEVCNGFAPFPPGFRSMPVKPAFVDVAATYLEYPTLGDDGSSAAAPVHHARPVHHAAAPAPAARSDSSAAADNGGQQQEQEEEQEPKKGGWGISRLWGR